MSEFLNMIKSQHPDFFTEDRKACQAKHLKVREGVGVTVYSEVGAFDVLGEDREKLLHSLLANEVSGLKVGQGNLSHLLNPKGKVQAEMKLFKLSDRLRILCEAPQKNRILQNIKMRIFRSDIRIEEPTKAYCAVGLHGPEAASVLDKLGTKLPEAEYHHHELMLADCTAWFWRDHQMGELGVIFWLEENAAQALWQSFSDQGLTVFGEPVQESLMMEAGVPRFGTDFNEDNFSLEVNLNKAVSNSKGCYLGQEPVARILSRGRVAKRMVGLQLTQPEPLVGVIEVWPEDTEKRPTEGKPLGHVLRNMFSPSLNQCIGFAMLKYAFLEETPNAKVQLFSEDGTNMGFATCQELPFVQQSELNWLAGGPEMKRVIAPHAKTRKK